MQNWREINILIVLFIYCRIIMNSKKILLVVYCSLLSVSFFSKIYAEQIEIISLWEEMIQKTLETNTVNINNAEYLFDRMQTNEQLSEERKTVFLWLFKQLVWSEYFQWGVFVKEDLLNTFLWEWRFLYWIPLFWIESLEKEWVSMTYCSKTAKLNLQQITCLGTDGIFSPNTIVQWDAITLIEQWRKKGELIAMPFDLWTIKKYLSTLHQKYWSVIFDLYVYRSWYEEKEESDYYRKWHRAVLFIWHDLELYVLDPYMHDQKPIRLWNYKATWWSEEQIVLFPKFWYQYALCPMQLKDSEIEQLDQQEDETVQNLPWDERKDEEDWLIEQWNEQYKQEDENEIWSEANIVISDESNEPLENEMQENNDENWEDNTLQVMQNNDSPVE